jgi:hypothetical protein
MNTHLLSVLALALIMAVPAFPQRDRRDRDGPQERDVQRRGEQQNPPRDNPTRVNPPRANRGAIPQPPVRRENARANPEPENHGSGRINNSPHVSNNRWYGHDRPNDRRYHLNRTFERGRFVNIGPAHRYSVFRFDRSHRRFWLPGGFLFEVAEWDWPLCADWCWDCGDDFVLYDDPDHIGWYLLYNIHTGMYVHVLYLGA